MLSSMRCYACGFIFCFTPESCASQPREAGARGPFWAFRVGSSFPPCFQLEPFLQRLDQWLRCVWGSLRGWGAVNGVGSGREAASWQSAMLTGEGCEGWNAGWEGRPRPPHRKFCCFSSRTGWRHPVEGKGGGADNSGRPPGSDQG